MGRKKKDEFEDLSEDFKDTATSMDESKIRQKLSEIALNQVELLKAKDEDEDLKQKKAIAKEAGAIYRDGTKDNRLKTKYLHRILGDLGKDNGSFEQ